jgi:hypothetical protein
MTDLKQRLAAVLASPKGQAMIQEGQQFSIEELQAAFAQVLAEAKDHERVVLEAAMNAVIARKANQDMGRWTRETCSRLDRLTRRHREPPNVLATISERQQASSP